MTFEEALNYIVSNIIALVPSLVIMLGVFISRFKNIEKKSDLFQIGFSAFEKHVDDDLKETKRDIIKLYTDTKHDMEGLVKDTTQQITSRVNGTLQSMQSELDQYRKILNETRDQASQLVLENKMLMNSLFIALGENVNHISSGLSKDISKEIVKAKAELEKFDPESILLDDYESVKDVIAQSVKLLGSDNVRQLLEVSGYEEKKTPIDKRGI